MEDVNPALETAKDSKESPHTGKIDDKKEANGGEETGIPSAGMGFGSEEEVREYYSKYAQQMGFGIYRRSSRCGEDGKVKYFTLACANAGKVRQTSANGGISKRPSAKTNCKAKINVAVESEERVYVCHVVLEHNHELSPGRVQQNIRKKVWSPRLPRERRSKTLNAVGRFEALSSVDGVTYSHHSANGYNHSPYNGAGPSTSGNVLHNLSNSSSPGVFQDFQDAFSCALVKRAVSLVKSGMVIGVGGGSTLSLFVGELGKLVKEGKLKDIVLVGTSYHTRRMARQFGVATAELNDVSGIDIAFDVVDEVDYSKNILQVSAANHTVQKVVYSIADMCIVLADHSKVVHRLGSKFPVAVEVLPIAVTPVMRRLIALGGVPEVRFASGKDGPVNTDLGNMIVDARFPNGIPNPGELERNINLIPGVVDNGIVSGVATTVIVAVRNDNDVDIVNIEELVRDVVLRRSYSVS